MFNKVHVVNKFTMSKEQKLIIPINFPTLILNGVGKGFQFLTTLENTNHLKAILPIPQILASLRIALVQALQHGVGCGYVCVLDSSNHIKDFPPLQITMV